MSNFDNTNTGSLWPNERREKDTHPNTTGSANIDGVEYWVSGWTKEKNGKKFISMSYKRKDEKPAAQPRSEQKPAVSDDIPW